MKIVTSYSLHAPRGYEWCAYDDNTYPDSPDGCGSTELAALEDLLWQVDDRPEIEAAVEAAIAKHKEKLNA